MAQPGGGCHAQMFPDGPDQITAPRP
jgi:hypothetical protein